MKATAVANSNIALVKYWGKRDDKLILPYNSSISVSLDGLFAKTTVEFDDNLKNDVFVLNGEEQSGEELERVVDTLNLIRQMAKIKKYARVDSTNNFPTAAGLASSAAGGAALAMAASKAAGLNLSEKELSIIARRNSGSACRSIEGGFVEWVKGSAPDGSDSYGVQIAPENHWPEFRTIVTVLTSKAKKIKSRAGMKQSVTTCPYYSAWTKEADKDTETMKKAIIQKDFKTLGEVAELNALKMHAVMMTTNPPIIYWLPETVHVIHLVQELRDNGIQCYFTMDAGPQVKILCLEKDVESIVSRLNQLEGVQEAIVCKLGGGAKLVN